MFVGSVAALPPECVFYLSSDRLICIFHHVKQIEDNEGLGDEGRACAPHTERSISSATQRPDVGEALISYALEIDGVPRSE